MAGRKRNPAEFCCLAAAFFFILLLVSATSELRAQETEELDGRIIRDIVVEIKQSPLMPEGFEITDKIRKRVHKVLLSHMRTRAGDPYDARTFDKDVKRLISKGKFWLKARVVPVADGVNLEMDITVRPMVEKVLLKKSDDSGMHIPEDIELEMLTCAGKYFGRYFLLHDTKVIKEYYQKRGYPFVTVESELKYSEDGVKVNFVVDKGPFTVLREIEFDGNENYTDEELYDIFKKKAPAQTLWREFPMFDWLIFDASYTSERVREGVELLLETYRSDGFLDAKVEVASLKFNEKKTDAKLTVKIDEGKRYYIRSISIEGNTSFSTEELMDKISTKPGEPYEKEALEKDIEAVAQVYQRNAFIYSRVLPRLAYDLEGNKIDLDIKIREGPKIYLEKVRIEGNNRTRDRVIRRQLSVYPGDKFDVLEMQESVQRLLNLRFFNSLEPTIEDTDEPDIKTLVLKVSERKTGQMKLGFSYSTAMGLQGVFAVTQPNFDYSDLPRSLSDFFSGNAFAGDGTTLSINLQPGKDHSIYSISYRDPYFMDTDTRFSIGFQYRDSNYLRWDQRNEGFHIGLGRNISRRLSFDLLYRLDINTLTNISPSSPIDVFLSEGTKNLSAIKPVITLDMSKVDIHATRYKGYSAVASYEYGGGFMGGEIDFSAAALKLSGYLPVYEDSEGFKHVLSLEMSGNWKEPHHNTDIIPWYERYFLGGPGTLRGFEWQGAGPKEGRDFIGGTVRAAASLEYSVPLPLGKEYFRGVLFFDTGNLTSGIEDFVLKDFRTAVGFGFRIRAGNSFVFVMDFGYPLKMLDGDDKRIFHFSFGTEF